MNKQTVKIEFSISSLLLVIAVGAGLVLAFLLRNIILSVFIAFILAAAIEPMLKFLQRFKLPKSLSLAITYALALGALALMAFIVFPPLVHQVELFVRNLTNLTSRAVEVVAGSGVNEAEIQQYTQRLLDFVFGRAEQISNSVLQVGLGVLSGVTSVVTIVVISFYIVAQKSELYDGLIYLMPKKSYEQVRLILPKVERKLGLWLRGQLLLGLLIGVLTWIGLTILQIDYALPLAIIAGILELVPLIGPILAAIPSIIIGLTISPAMAVAVTLLYLIVQQLESNLIVPKVMERAVGLNPLLIIIALLAGGSLMGIMGAIIAVPVAVVVSAILEEVRSDTADKARIKE